MENIPRYYCVNMDLANQIKDTLARILHEDVHVVGDGGIIIATTQPGRVGTRHEGAARLVTGEVGFTHINGKKAKLMDGVLPGYGVPLVFDNQIVGAIGVSGDPERVKPYAQLAAAFANLMIKTHLLEKALLQQTETALRESEEKYRLIAENFPNGIIMLYDRELHCLMAEGKGLEQVGLSREMLLGKKINDIFPRDLCHKLEAYCRAALDGNESTFEISWNNYVLVHTLVPFRNVTGNVHAVMGVIENITLRRHAEDKAHYLASHDLLTGLPNRAIFYDRLQQAIIQSERTGQALAVIFLDLDHFKTINDGLGHDGGDKLLRMFSERLQETLRKSDTVARAGGDEFLILTQNIAQLENTFDVLQRIKNSFSRPFQYGGSDYYITCSAGVALYPDDGRNTETLIKKAHMAMNSVKEEGRNNYSFYTPAIKIKAKSKLKLRNSLYHALERDEFTMYYQPQVDISSGKITGLEALLRWQHPEKGLISPVEFISTAEESGLIQPMGEWVLSTVCSQKRAWINAGLPPVHVAVNLSVRQFQQKNLLQIIDHFIRQNSLKSKCLEIEVTENIAMHEPHAVAKTLQRIREMGITISIDDFGTEYSSLSYLKILPVDKIKIAMPFIKGINLNVQDSAIVAAVIVLGQNLGFGVIAEGVETKEQLDFLRQHGCDVAQGYYFYRPMPAENIEKLFNPEH